jgi:hypothetical protein
MYNRNWLRTQIASFLKDQSLSSNLDTFIDLGAKRVSQVLECWEMEGLLENTLVTTMCTGVVDGEFADNGLTLLVIDGGDAFNTDPDAAPLSYIVIPATVRRLLGVQVLDRAGSIWRNLKSIPKHEAQLYKGPAGQPVYYYVETRYIHPLPAMAAAYRTQVLFEVVIPVGDNEIDALASYPMVFLNAALQEAYDFKQDPEMSARYESKWVTEAEAARAIYRGEHGGETLAMRAV